MTTDARDLGLLTLRLGVGATLAAHGAQKLFGWFGGGGLVGTGRFFDSVGFTPGKLNAVLAGAGEAGGGTLLALGLATPAAGAAAAGTMVVAASMHKGQGFFAQGGGYEYPAVLALTAASLALGGPGQLSLDAALGQPRQPGLGCASPGSPSSPSRSPWCPCAAGPPWPPPVPPCPTTRRAVVSCLRPPS